MFGGLGLYIVKSLLRSKSYYPRLISFAFPARKAASLAKRSASVTLHFTFPILNRQKNFGYAKIAVALPTSDTIVAAWPLRNYARPPRCHHRSSRQNGCFSRRKLDARKNAFKGLTNGDYNARSTPVHVKQASQSVQEAAF